MRAAQGESPTEPGLAAGEVVAGRYRVERRLGRGGSSVVYAATHTWTRRPVALKVLRAPISARAVERALREARVTAELQHANLVEVLDMDLHDGVPFLVLERLEGETLREHLGRSRPTPEQALAAIAPVIEALAALHAAGVVHRDVKPDNVFLHVTRAGRVVPKLIDLGICRRRGEAPGRSGAERGLLGTPRYMSPEQLAAPDTAEAASDVWSVGMTLVEALTGSSAFEGGRLADGTEQMMHDATEPLRALPPPLCGVLERALARDPAERYADAGELGAALARARGELEYRADALPPAALGALAARASATPPGGSAGEVASTCNKAH